MHDPEYEADLARRTHTRAFAQEKQIVFSALDCALNGEKAVYASSELTSGWTAYQLLERYEARTIGELAERMGEDPHRSQLLDRNIEEASRFARRLRARLGGGQPVVTPAPFAAPGWTQAEYLDFWEELIRTRVSAVWFNEAWEYSNGCTFEFSVAWREGVPTFDASGGELSLERAIALVEGAVRDLATRGIAPGRLPRHLDHLYALRGAAARDAAATE
jgi:hypothetical protein